MIITLDELKTYLKITTTDEDARLEQIRSGAEKIVKQYCNNEFKHDTYEEEVYVENGLLHLKNTPVENIEYIKTSEGTELQYDIIFLSAGIVKLQSSYTGLAKVKYVGGETPDDIKFATLRLAEYLYNKPAGVASESVGELKAVYELPDVWQVLDRYRKVRI